MDDENSINKNNETYQILILLGSCILGILVGYITKLAR